MPHIHTEPNQHDITVSAYIVRHEHGEWKCLVHFHQKFQSLMQIGGHLELNETPWQAMVHELIEESGYQVGDVQVVQPRDDRMAETAAVIHPVPFAMNTHNVGNMHFHSDLCYGFVAKNLPSVSPSEGESDDLRWLTLSELEGCASRGEAPSDAVSIYHYLVDGLDSYHFVDADTFSLEKPSNSLVTYKTGAPGTG